MHISPYNTEIERIYAQVLTKGSRSIAITAANPNEGVTSLALALAQRNLLAGHSTVIVDLNLHNPSFKSQLSFKEEGHSESLFNAPQLISVKDGSIVLTGITAPVQRKTIMKLRKPGVLKECINELKNSYHTIFFDTSAINQVNANNIPAELVAAACDGCLLVVLAGQTTESTIYAATQRLALSEADLLGCVFNDQYNPPLKDELQREINRLRPRFNGIANWLDKKICQQNLLNMEV